MGNEIFIEYNEIREIYDLLIKNILLLLREISKKKRKKRKILIFSKNYP